MPRRPASMDPFAVEILEGLQKYEEGADLVLGGHFALKHYLDRRDTHDIDAWWPMEADAEKREAVMVRLRQVVGRVAEAHGLLAAERNWGDVVSLELRRGGGGEDETVFSVQIARRSIELDAPIVSPWPPVRIETLRDNLASKMSALVARGHPRDFLDIETAVSEGFVTVDECWSLWLQRNPGGSVPEAELSVLRNLEAIELRRPASSLPSVERTAALKRRDWVRRDFLRGRGVKGLGP
jgi:hypothetical protein